MLSRIILYLTIGSTLLYLGCGGGGGGDSVVNDTVSGTAASGAAIVGEVILKDAGGNTVGPQTIGSDGSYSLIVNGLTAPFIVKAEGTVGDKEVSLLSTATGKGRVNVNPLTNLAVAKILETGDTKQIFDNFTAQAAQVSTTAIANAVTEVKAIIKTLIDQNEGADIDPFSGAYVADHSGLDAVLDAIEIEVDNTGAIEIKDKVTDIVVTATSLTTISTATPITTAVATQLQASVTTVQEVAAFLSAFASVVSSKELLLAPSDVEQFFLTTDYGTNSGLSRTQAISDVVHFGAGHANRILKELRNSELSTVINTGSEYFINFSSIFKDGSRYPVAGVPVKVVKEADAWKFKGNGYKSNVSGIAFGALKSISSKSEIALTQALHLEVTDPGAVGFGKITVSGPGLTQNVENNSTLSEVVYLSDSAIAEIPATGAVYQVSIEDTGAQVLETRSRALKKPLTSGALTDGYFPVISGLASHMLTAANIGGVMSFNYSKPTSAATALMWAEFKVSNGNDYILEDYHPLALNQSSSNFMTTTPEGTIVKAYLTVYAQDLKGRVFATSWEFRPPNTLPVVSNLAANSDGSHVTITYDITDPDFDDQTGQSVTLHYSTDGGTTFTAATVIGNTGGLNVGADQSLVWDADADLTITHDSVMIKLVPNDGNDEGAAVTAELVINVAPVISNLAVTGSSQALNGNVAVTYDLADTESDAVSIVLQYSLDGGTTFNDATTQGTTTGITPGTGKTITWASKSDFTDDQATVMVRLTPSDAAGAGSAVASSNFVVNNSNALPVIANLQANLTGTNVTITFDISDADASHQGNLSATIEYSTGGAFTAAETVTGGALTGLSDSTGNSVVWAAGTDLSANHQAVTVRVTPNDGEDNGVAVTATAFEFVLNAAPTVSNLAVGGANPRSGNITLTFDVADTESDNCNVKFQVDTGSGYQDIPASHFTGGSLALNSCNAVGTSLTWESGKTIDGNASAVKVQAFVEDTLNAFGSFNASTGVEVTSLQIENNVLPSISNVTAGSNRGNITITYDLTDPTSGDAGQLSLSTVEFSTDGGNNWLPASVTGSTSGLSAGTGLSLVWDTSSITVDVASALFRIAASDSFGAGSEVQSAAFPVLNFPLQLRLSESTYTVSAGQSIPVTVMFEGDISNIDGYTFTICPVDDTKAEFSQVTLDLSGFALNAEPDGSRCYVGSGFTTAPPYISGTNVSLNELSLGGLAVGSTTLRIEVSGATNAAGEDIQHGNAITATVTVTQ